MARISASSNMAINPSQLGAQDVSTNFDVTIELLTSRPDAGAYMTTPDIPNRLVGYYDAINDRVELYIVDGTGYRFLRIS